MLAYKFNEARWNKLTKPVMMQPKYNGNRCRTIFNGNGSPTFLSSSAAEITSVNHLKPQLEALKLYNMELDGELYIHGMPHQDINGIVRRTNTVHVDASKIEYHIFDAPAENLKQYERLAITEAVRMRAKERGTTHIKVSPYKYANNVHEMLAYLVELIDFGYEGVIIRDLNGYYVRKKTTNMLKLKPTLSEAFTIVGYAQGESKVCKECRNTTARCTCDILIELISIPKPVLGAVVCKTKDGVEFNIGGGPYLTEARRISAWIHPDSLIGKTAVAKFHELSEDGVPKSCVLLDVV